MEITIKSWKTTVASIVSAAASFVLFSAFDGDIAWPHWVVKIALFASAGGLVAFGVTAKDYNVTGTGK